MGLVVEAMHEIGVTQLSRWIFNCYVIHNDGALVVVDAGLPSAATDLTPIIDRLGGRVAAIVATHGHSDHLGGAAGLAAKYEAPIHLPAVTMKYLTGERPRTPSVARVARIWPTLVDQPMDRIGVGGLLTGARAAGYGTPAGMRWPGPTPAGTLTDGEPLPGAGEWQIVATPGHTDDSIAFWNPASRTLLSGDAVLTARGCAWHTPETVDTPAAQRTRERLQKLPVAHLLPGHGRAVHADTTVWERQRR
ncbi:MBL fold metallo-hydrolase [Mycobacterium sp. 852002-51057_SCH5723018]|uniref:MBL fold metallo-hydrolase n=1 Tax=Mycobacterium sp. 852002-51057_SCH5723018 TaxID=1834094 RepID=UPI0007FFD5DF|nr:MBL fold metallo-hydrolase [Mycobacterium sp. 852002-51057_SCH5723018]OBG28743.1 MBL fold metallo-hydrolase [Mycobacterium sp. 852002-51057_SCH5723018]